MFAKQSLDYCCVLATMEFRFILCFGVALLAVMLHMTVCVLLYVGKLLFIEHLTTLHFGPVIDLFDLPGAITRVKDKML